MAIEAGSRCGMVAVDNKTIDYVKDKPLAPTGKEWDKAACTTGSTDFADDIKCHIFSANMFV
jgi:homoaconitase/3-isopropylmalate dehydratase large subunit